MRKFIISYRNELGGNREFIVARRATLLDAVAEYVRPAPLAPSNAANLRVTVAIV